MDPGMHVRFLCLKKRNGTKAPFDMKEILKYSENNSVSKNTKVLNTSRFECNKYCDFRTEVFSKTVVFVKYWRMRCDPLFSKTRKRT
jgi:hypothetical protein